LERAKSIWFVVDRLDEEKEKGSFIPRLARRRCQAGRVRVLLHHSMCVHAKRLDRKIPLHVEPSSGKGEEIRKLARMCLCCIEYFNTWHDEDNVRALRALARRQPQTSAALSAGHVMKTKIVSCRIDRRPGVPTSQRSFEATTGGGE